MFNRDIIIELSKHLDPKNVANLACLNKEMNQLTQDELFWEYMCSNYSFKGIKFYETYQDNFKIAWKLFHPQQYSMLLIYSDDYYRPLGVFNTTSIDLIVDKIIEIYNSGEYPEFNENVNRAIMYKFGKSKIYDLKKEKLITMINRWSHKHLALETISVYPYPGNLNELEPEIICLYYTGEQSFRAYGCFLGTKKRDDIIDMIGYLLNESDEFLKDNIFCKESDDDDDVEEEFKDNFCEKLKNRLVENEDIEYILDNEVEYDYGSFVLREIPFYKV